LIAIAALLYPKESEDHDAADLQENNAQSLGLKIQMIKQFLNVNEIRNTLIFFFVVSIVCPNLEEFFVYFNEYEHHQKPIFEGYAAVAVGGVASILVLVYNTVLAKRVDLRTIVLTASAFRVFSSALAIY